MKRFTITAASVLVLALAACSSTVTTTAAPGAVSGKACCKENKAATCDAAAKATCDAAAPAAVASPGAVSGQKKSGCGPCPMSSKSADCPLTKTNG